MPEIDAITRNLKLDVARLEAENRGMRHQVALAKEAIAILQAALQFYGDHDANASAALRKLEEIRLRAKAR